jgi:DNA repair protein RadC
MLTKQEQQIINDAKWILSRHLKLNSVTLTNSARAKDYAYLNFADSEQELFGVLYLTNQHQLIDLEVLFKGTIDGAAVYPREVVKGVLSANAAAVIFIHNHPSGIAEPSQADINITGKLQNALATVEVRVLDHFIIGSDQVMSFSERGLL